MSAKRYTCHDSWMKDFSKFSWWLRFRKEVKVFSNQVLVDNRSPPIYVEKRMILNDQWNIWISQDTPFVRICRKWNFSVINNSYFQFRVVFCSTSFKHLHIQRPNRRVIFSPVIVFAEEINLCPHSCSIGFQVDLKNGVRFLWQTKSQYFILRCLPPVSVLLSRSLGSLSSTTFLKITDDDGAANTTQYATDEVWFLYSLLVANKEWTDYYCQLQGCRNKDV